MSKTIKKETRPEEKLIKSFIKEQKKRKVRKKFKDFIKNKDDEDEKE